MKAPLFSPNGERIGEIELPDDIFGVKPKRHVLWEVVKMYLANRRVGTHKAKTRAEVSYSGRKIWPQKGLGRARHGDRGAPIFVKGGKAHGPKPRDYSYQVPKKVKRLALKMALSDRAMENRILVFENFQFDQPKTKLMVNLLKTIGLDGKRTLVVQGDYNKNLYLSGRNIPKVETRLAKDANAYDVLWSEYVLMDRKALETLKERLS